VRECRVVGLLDDGQTAQALVMVDDRHLTSHTSHDPLAVAIAARLPGHVALLRVRLEHLCRQTV